MKRKESSERSTDCIDPDLEIGFIHIGKDWEGRCSLSSPLGFCYVGDFVEMGHY
jgi:hypothetical protein